VLFPSCSRKKEEKKKADQTYLDVHIVLGSTPEQLMKRFGPPTTQVAERDSIHFGTITWENIEGVRVFAVVKNEKCAYVHYTFKEMEPFEENRAFRVIGIERPQQAPQLIPQSQAKRWKPFGQYDRLTVNPETKGVAIRAFPFPM
jgi:hypothetical protein